MFTAFTENLQLFTRNTFEKILKFPILENLIIYIRQYFIRNLDFANNCGYTLDNVISNISTISLVMSKYPKKHY